MKLELGKIQIKDVQKASESKVENGILYINEEEIKEIVLADDHIVKCEVEIAKPGESTRITPIKDVIEPRCKVEGDCEIFPGVISKVDRVGEGRTHALKGLSLIHI